jgi:hypothetical protein
VVSSEKLREAAFEEFELRQQAEQIKKLERAARREAARRAQADSATVPLPEENKDEVVTAKSPADDLPESLDQGTIDRLKNLIQSWDKQLTGSN